MMKLSKGGILLTGLGAYLILSKGISAFRGSIKDLSEAIKWRAYYNSKKEGVVPPGYSIRSTSSSNESENKSSLNDSEDALNGLAKKAIDTIFDSVKAKKEASKGEIEVSEEETIDDPNFYVDPNPETSDKNEEVEDE